MKEQYGHDFYKNRYDNTIHSAATILSLVRQLVPTIHSAIDFGCGVGTWLSVLHQNGTETIQGFDGTDIDHTLLEIPGERFQQKDFEQPIALEQRYDLAISLEVAEHLPASCANTFIDTLASASDFILFSAAIPLQGGRGHINEQWPDYWARLFNERGYITLDAVRSHIWEDAQIPYWYRQNILMYVRQERIAELTIDPLLLDNPMPLSLVHPDGYQTRVKQLTHLTDEMSVAIEKMEAMLMHSASNR